MAGIDTPKVAPWPFYKEDGIMFRIGGHVPQGLTTTIVDRLYVPWSAYIRKVVYYYIKTDTNDIDAITLATVDDTKTVVAAQDGNNITDGVQTLHADVAADAYQIDKGDYITLSGDTSASSEGGIIHAEIYLKPVYN